MIARLAARFMEFAERLYLRANGWTKDTDLDYWSPPANYPFKKKYPHRFGHAINSQKQLTYNPRYK